MGSYFGIIKNNNIYERFYICGLCFYMFHFCLKFRANSVLHLEMEIFFRWFEQMVLVEIFMKGKNKNC